MEFRKQNYRLFAIPAASRLPPPAPAARAGGKFFGSFLQKELSFRSFASPHRQGGAAGAAGLDQVAAEGDHRAFDV